ncbi:MAG: ribonuclease J [Chromatiales bacterium]|nr:ribonuclease J [Chromatiales bacterium]
MTHSIPEANALYIRTAAGDVFHTGDWKFDDGPVVGDTGHIGTVQALGKRGVGAVVGDSTNATVPGKTGSESALTESLHAIVRAAKGRVVVSCFASNVARLVTLVRAATAAERRVSVHGRSLSNMLGVAKSCGYFDEPYASVSQRHVAYLPREEVFAVVTGSQGEPRAALARLAAGTHPDFNLEEGDTVLFSSKRIPGNEAAIDRIIEALVGRGVSVIEDGELPTHVSGHPAQDELRTLYRWLSPRLVVPTHGEPAHLAANATLAKTSGVALTLPARNGDVCVIGGGQPGIIGKVASGRLEIDRP